MTAATVGASDVCDLETGQCQCLRGSQGEAKCIDHACMLPQKGGGDKEYKVCIIVNFAYNNLSLSDN